MRNPNGFGSVYMLKGKRRNPWVARVTTGISVVVDEEGNPKRIYDREVLGYYPTKTEAKNALQNYKAGILPIVQPKEGITLKEVYDEWLATRMGRASKKSIDGYILGYSYLDKYLDVPFEDLRTVHLQKIIDDVHSQGKSKPVLAKIRSLLKMLYDYGIQNDIVSKNYAQFIEMPKSGKKEKKRFSDLDIKRLEELAPTEEMAQLLLVLIYTGFRINELLELTRFNINLDKMIIIGGGKTDAGTDRVVPIHQKILPIVKEWSKRDNFVMIEGRVRSYENIRHRFNEFKGKYGFDDDLTIHCTRHTFASMLANKGVDPIFITKVMGHSNYSLTASVYTHLDTEILAKEIGKI